MVALITSCHRKIGGKIGKPKPTVALRYCAKHHCRIQHSIIKRKIIGRDIVDPRLFFKSPVFFSKFCRNGKQLFLRNLLMEKFLGSKF